MNGDIEASSLDVVLVEDNPGDIHLIREAIAESNHDVSLTVATDGEEALETLSRRTRSETSPDLVLLDLNVPKADGRTVLERMRNDADIATVPVIVLSSSESRDAMRETRALNADGYFVKPVDPNEFLSLIQRIADSLADDGPLPAGKYADLDRDE